ncbi:MAG TPA: hypothetical protein VGR37_10045 [Longimicrobiaceae bacterium]|nr:hypothetical protein [Longimicrobiaceae bacterium]
MIPGLGTVIDRVSGLFGKGYLLAGFFPVLLIGLLSLLAGYDASERVQRDLDRFLALEAGKQALGSAAFLGVVVVVGFVFWSLNSWFRALLQGNILPERMRQWLVEDQKQRLDKMQQELDVCEDQVHEYRLLHGRDRPPDVGLPPTWLARLLAARKAGAATGIESTVRPSPKIQGEFRKVRRLVARLEPVPTEALENLCSRLEEELRKSKVTGGSALDQLHVEFRDLADKAMARAQNLCDRALTHRRSRFPVDLEAVGPTRMANVAELHRNRALNCYSLDTEVFWLHLQRMATADEHFRPILDDAKTRLDVSVAMTIAFAVTALVWAPVLALRSGSLPLFLLFAVGLPAAAVIAGQTAVVNLRLFGEAVTAAVDLFRFDLLKGMHLKIPADSEVERDLWERLTRRSQLLGKNKLEYTTS